MIVVGGSYKEICHNPEWERIFGSGMRAAVALSSLAPGLSFHTYAFEGWARDVRATMAALGAVATVVEIPFEIAFEYFHPLRKSGIPEHAPLQSPLEIEGDVVLGFGFVEGSARIDGGRVVYDPQTSVDPVSFRAGGSRARELAYVLSDADLRSIGRSDDPTDAANRIMVEEGAAVVIARHAIGNATVYVGDRPGRTVPAYKADRWSKIGSGDVFCAAFAYHWGTCGSAPLHAADLASRTVAYFNDGQRLPLPHASELAALTPLPLGTKPGLVCVSGPSATLAQRWLMEEVLSQVEEMGAPAAYAEDAPRVRPPRSGYAAMLSLVDGGDAGTNLRLGTARARDMPVVVLSEATPMSDLVMLAGTACEIAPDMPSAVYLAYLASLRPFGER